MLKTMLRLIIYALIAYALRSVFEIILPLPTESMMDGILNLKKSGDAALFKLLRYGVWIIFIALAVKYTKPLFSFMLPITTRLSPTKPFRRFQGVFAELLLFVAVYYISGLLIAVYQE